MTIQIKLNLVQLVFFPIAEILIIFFLANWLRDLIVLEWELLLNNELLTQGLGLIIMSIIVTLGIHIIYCIIKMYYITTKFISAEKLEQELNRLKNRE